MEEKSQNFANLDDRDKQLLTLLTENARIKLTTLAKKIQLSIDATRKRLIRLEKEVITKYTIQVNAQLLGLPLGVHIYLRLKDLREGDYDKLVRHLRTDPRVINLISMIGDYDLYVVMLAINAEDLEKRKLAIRQQFSHIIADWKEVVVAKIHKLEEYSFV